MGISTHNTALLIDKVKAELIKRGYKPESVQRYQSCWNDLLKFATAHAIDSYSPQTGMFFLEEIYGMTVFASLSEQEKLRARAINLLNDYTQNGMIFAGNSTSSTDYLKFYQSVLDDFKKHQVVKYQISPSTLVKYNDYLGKFLLYLEEHHISSLQQITTGIIQDYCNTFATLLQRILLQQHIGHFVRCEFFYGI